ncbi:MAG: glycosyltransferase family 87 protein [Actinomycetaceae bacterium]|nr:glycosyltransferase family 87 protein [Actinomycetaceae bacterium]
MNGREIVRVAIAAAVAIGGVWAVFLLLPAGTLVADVHYYYAWLTFEGGPHFDRALIEYPLPATLLLAIPLLGADSVDGYVIAYTTAIMVLIGLWFAILAHANRGRRVSAGALDPVIAWAFLVLATGPLIIFRFDLVPALFVGVALLLVATSPALFAHAIAWGTAMKLWPIVLIPFALADRRRWRAVGVFALSGVVFVGISALVGGVGRVFSPLAWQGARGLHTESVAASWITLARVVRPESWNASLSDNNSVDYFGPGVDVTAHVATVATVLVLGFLVVLAVRAVRNQVSDPVTIAIAAVAVISLFIASNKVFSPQYIVWILPAWTALLVLNARAEEDAVDTGWLHTQTLLLIALTVLTQLVYPTLYRYLFWEPEGVGLGVASLLLVLRNVILVAWAIAAARAAWIRTGTR